MNCQEKYAVAQFMVELLTGQLEDDRWDWDVEKCDWQLYKKAALDPTIIRTTVYVFLNNFTELTEECYVDACFRAFQYFRLVMEGYKPEKDFVKEELAEHIWYVHPPKPCWCKDYELAKGISSI